MSYPWNIQSEGTGMSFQASTSAPGFQKSRGRSAGRAAQWNFQAPLRDRKRGDSFGPSLRAAAPSGQGTNVARGASVPSWRAEGFSQSSGGVAEGAAAKMSRLRPAINRAVFFMSGPRFSRIQA